LCAATVTSIDVNTTDIQKASFGFSALIFYVSSEVDRAREN